MAYRLEGIDQLGEDVTLDKGIMEGRLLVPLASQEPILC
jgi:hypothetical protein